MTTEADEVRLTLLRGIPMPTIKLLIGLIDEARAERDACCGEHALETSRTEAMRMVLRGESNHTLREGDAEWSPAYAEAVAMASQVAALTAALAEAEQALIPHASCWQCGALFIEERQRHCEYGCHDERANVDQLEEAPMLAHPHDIVAAIRARAGEATTTGSNPAGVAPPTTENQTGHSTAPEQSAVPAHTKGPGNRVPVTGDTVEVRIRSEWCLASVVEDIRYSGGAFWAEILGGVSTQYQPSGEGSRWRWPAKGGGSAAAAPAGCVCPFPRTKCPNCDHLCPACCVAVAASIQAAIQKEAKSAPVGPCCEGVSRVERVPGDATTLVGWTCPIHGRTVAPGAKP